MILSVMVQRGVSLTHAALPSLFRAMLTVFAVLAGVARIASCAGREIGIG
jgi:hypothetical protein